MQKPIEGGDLKLQDMEDENDGNLEFLNSVIVKECSSNCELQETCNDGVLGAVAELHALEQHQVPEGDVVVTVHPTIRAGGDDHGCHGTEVEGHEGAVGACQTCEGPVGGHAQLENVAHHRPWHWPVLGLHSLWQSLQDALTPYSYFDVPKFLGSSASDIIDTETERDRDLER